MSITIERLKLARSIIEQIPDNVIDLDSIQKERSCGTVCCAAGWLAHDARFQALGLSPPDRPDSGGILGFNGRQTWWDVALSRVFEFDARDPHGRYDVYDIFGVRGCSKFDPIEVRNDDSDVSGITDKQLWLRRVDSYIAQAEAAS